MWTLMYHCPRPLNIEWIRRQSPAVGIQSSVWAVEPEDMGTHHLQC
jgi:hypothetical protein